MEYMAVLNEMGLDRDILSEDEFEKVKELSRRKAKLTGKGESYIPLLLPDVIKEWLFNRATLHLAMMLAE